MVLVPEKTDQQNRLDKPRNGHKCTREFSICKRWYSKLVWKNKLFITWF